MVWVDYALLGLVAISSVIGLFRGLTREALSLLSWACGIWIGLNYSRDFTVLLTQWIEYPSLRMAVAFVALLLLTLLVGGLVGYLLGVLVKKTGLTGTDRFLGMVFGIARGILVVTIVIVLAGLTPLPQDSWWRESQLIPPFQSVAEWLRGYLPQGLAGYLDYG